MIGTPYRSLRGFPSETVHAGTPLYRCHGSKGLWWFAKNARGRFNLSKDDGTCYFGLDRATAVREVLRHELWDNATTTTNVAGRFVSEVFAPRSYRVARANHDDAQNFGATNALSAQTSQPIEGSEPIYSASRVWAMRFKVAGFDGIRYRSHYTSTDRGLALFGNAGARMPGDPRWPTDPTPELLAKTCGRKDVGITVYATKPPSSSLSFVMV